MRRFNAPPGWPPPPNVRWRPPRGWTPPESWPDPPPGWAFWVDERDRRVLGPIGRHGGPSRAWPIAGTLVAGLLLFGAPQVFGGDDSGEVASDPPSVSGSSERPGTEATTAPTAMPSPRTSPSKSVETSAPSPKPTPSTSPTAVPTPAPTPTSPSAVPSSPVAPTANSTPAVYYKNCGAVRAAGKAPLLRGQPGYSARLDRNGDGIACDHGNS